MTAMAAETRTLCRCGCGEYLPVGSTRQFKRGHRQRYNKQVADAVEHGNGVFDGYDFRFEPGYNTEPINLDMIPYEPVNDVLSDIPDDPVNETLFDTAKEQFRPTRGMVKDIEGKVAFMLTTTGMAVGLPDPVCGNAILQNTPEITKALVPILMQSPGVIAWFNKTSNVMLWVNLMMAMAPVFGTVLGHHFGSKEERQPVPDNGQMNINPNMYGVQ